MSRRAQDVLFVLLGVGGLVLKGQYSGPADELVHSYGGNVAASFAVYFLAKRVTARSNLPRASAAALAFMAVQLFEVLDGFGLMKNVYDRLDLAANTAGIALAIALDIVVNRRSGMIGGGMKPQTAVGKSFAPRGSAEPGPPGRAGGF